MSQNIIQTLYEDIPPITPARKRYIAQAFGYLPAMEAPSILDIGCGPGEPTLELARLSKGHVIGLDINQGHLDRLKENSLKAGLSEKVRPVRMSMFNLDFQDESFDVVWSEGSIYVIGFSRGLKEWRRLIKPGRFLVIHDMVWLRPGPPQEMLDYWKARYPEIDTVGQNLKKALICGYRVIDRLPMPENFWWSEYYEQMEKRVEEQRCLPGNSTAELAAIESAQNEIVLYKRHSAWYGSCYFILQKDNQGLKAKDKT